jgi:hypothetical protein
MIDISHRDICHADYASDPSATDREVYIYVPDDMLIFTEESSYLDSNSTVFESRVYSDENI